METLYELVLNDIFIGSRPDVDIRFEKFDKDFETRSKPLFNRISDKASIGPFCVFSQSDFGLIKWALNLLG